MDKLIKTSKVIVLTFFLLSLFACDKPSIDCEYPDYSECNTIEPDNGLLTLKITIDDDNEKVPVTLYYGRYENDITAFVDTVKSNTVEYKVPVDVYYSVKAEYRSGERKINVIDGGYLYKKSYLVCDSTCWVVKDVDLNLKLKY